MPKTILLIANIISVVFSPVLTLPISFLIYIYNIHLTQNQLSAAIYILVGIGIIPSLITFWLLKKFNKISDLDIRNRQQRPLAFGILILIIGLMVILMRYFGLVQIAGFVQLILLQFIAVFLITLYWKISGHTSSVTLLGMTIIYYYPQMLLISLIMILLVTWSRIYRKNHTVLQAIGGIVLSYLIFQLGIYYKLV